jgi:glycosyltransferase involved in cell wall biosynthesis
MAAEPLSVAIIARDEGATIGAAIESVRGLAAEVVVVDSGSADDTVAVAGRLGARVLVEPWRGFAAQKNLAVGRCAHDWVFVLDADERMTPELRGEVAALLATGPDRAGYRVPRRNHFLGQWIRHGGWWPDSSLRLFDRRRGRFGDRAVHESVQLDGGAPAGLLRGALVHETCRDVAEFRARQDRYAALAAEELRKEGRRARWWDRAVRPAAAFLRSYVFRAGFLDGRAGLQIAAINARYARRKYAHGG